MRLIDANKLNCLLGIAEKDIYVKYWIDRMPTIDPETLPIVQELRKELARVTAERDALIRDMKVYGSGCYSCKHFDEPNGKCKAEEPCGVNNNWEWRGIREVPEDE